MKNKVPKKKKKEKKNKVPKNKQTSYSGAAQFSGPRSGRNVSPVAS